MNNKIKAAAQKFVNHKFETSSITKQEWGAYIQGFQDALKESGVEELRDTLRGILEIGKRDMSNPKYDGYFTEARAALSKSDLFFNDKKQNDAT